MISQTVFPLIKRGRCDICYKRKQIYLVFGLSNDISWDYLCNRCIEKMIKVNGDFKKCSSCGCLLNKVFNYPQDCVIKDQKQFCGLCFNFVLLEDLVISNTPKAERKITLEALENTKK